MKTTKTLAYALACIQELAKGLGQFVQVSEIAAAQNIPAAYCQKVLLALSKAGIVMSVKGQGFSLMLNPESINTLRVVRALNENTAGDGENSAIRGLTDTLTAKVNNALANLTVAEVIVASR